MPRLGVAAYVVGVLALFFAGESGASGGDKHALLEVKSAVTEDPLGFFSDWDPADRDPCSWTGVSCDPRSRRVTALRMASVCSQEGNFSLLYPCSKNLTGKLLKGKLSPGVAELSELRVLSLSFNGFTGELPSEIGKLRFLKVLDLGFNGFSGAVPLSLQNCTSLQVINFSGNRFNGTVPLNLAPFSSAHTIALSYNLFTGPIGDKLGTNCQFLEHLDLSGNSLSGQIPFNLGNCRKLKSLILSSNMLQGRIPSSLGNLGMLQVLDLSRNFLSDSVPRELSNCRQLKLLVLKNIYGSLISVKQDQDDGDDDYNYFDGEFPSSILEIPSLRILWAPKSNLEGKFPQNWSKVPNLEMLNLADNFFTGELPASIANCKGLNLLDLSSNNLTGLLPDNMAVPCMAVFNISGNFLSGNIPNFAYDKCSNKFGNLVTSGSDLLSFYSNFFYRNAAGGILSFSERVAVLHDFSNNLFTGAAPPLLIPPEILSARPFYGFWMNKNNLKGNLSEYSFDKCLSFEGMVFDISSNRITGEIPSDIATVCRSTMKVLNMAGNDLIGSFPRAFIYLDSLLHLNLSGNKLEGQVPSFIGQLKDLRTLSLSVNNFRGIIPQELSQLASMEVLELNFNTLSGEIPPEIAKLEHLNTLRLDHNNLSGQIPVGFENMTSLSVFNVSFNNFSGPVPKNPSLGKCENVQGNPNLKSCSNSSVSDWEQRRNISQQESQPPSGNPQGKNSFNPIEIASIISASIIVFILVSLILLFAFMKSFGSKSVSGQGSERKEVVTCNDIGVELTYENVVRATGGFNVQNCIGSGGFGATYKAEITPGVVVAVKRLSLGRFQGVQQFSAEIRTLGRVQHPNLVTLIGYHVSESEMFLIYNYLPGGNLEKFIQHRPKRTVVWSMLHKIALDIARALTYLHDECVPRVLHRDIKPSNILLDNNFNAYLSDFGLARLLGTSETHATTDVAGTFGYVAPEYAMTCRVSDKADVYSYGVVLLELISDKKALDPSFSSYGNGFNIVAWASMLLREGRSDEFFTAGLWENGPHDDLIEILHLAIMCTGESLTARPTMRQVAQRLKRIQPTGS